MLRMNRDAYRRGQVGGHDAILALAPEKIVSIVIPTRYGKSDVIRLSYLDAYYRDMVSCCVVLSPACNLERQMIRKDKIDEMLRRYRIALPSNLGCMNPTAGGVDAFVQWRNLIDSHIKSGPFIISTTHQFAVRHGLGADEWLTKWARAAMYATEGKPPIFYIDECHLGSDANRTGELAKNLRQAGAYVVVLTATPYRQDGQQIPGFQYDLLEYDTVIHAICQRADIPDHIKVQLRETLRGTYRMVADWEYTWKEAWAESPSPLCNIDLIEVDITEALVEKGLPGEAGSFRDMSKQQAQKYLGKIVRMPKVQRYCVEVLIDKLRQFKAASSTTAAIVFVGNDTEEEENHEAKAVERIIRDYDKGLRVVIATSTTQDAGKTIEDFVKGKGDILIVKMMAGLGLDCPRLKVGLDLSPIRTEASYAQRLMRIATTSPQHKVAAWITPADPAALELFAMLVTASDGRMKRTEESQILEEWVKPTQKQDQPAMKVLGLELGEVHNNQQITGNRAFHSSYRAFMAEVPELAASISQAKIMRAFEVSQGGVVPEEQHRDLGEHLQRIRRQIQTTRNQLVAARLSRKRGVGYQQGAKDPDFAREHRAAWGDMLNYFSLTWEWQIDTETNEGLLEQILEWYDAQLEVLNA